MKYAAGKGMGVMTYGSLGGGILTGKIREYREYAPSDSRNRFYKHFKEPKFSKVMKLLRVMDGISEKNGGVALSQIALNWSAQKDIVSTCVSSELRQATRSERTVPLSTGSFLLRT